MSLGPHGPPQAYQTYQVRAPIETHWQPATCAEVACEHYVNGWLSEIDESTELGQRQAYYIRHDRSRRHVEERQPNGLTWFSFEPGQDCFGGAHIKRLEREELFVIRGGDRRGNPTGRLPQLLAPTAWVDDFGEHQEKLADLIEQG